MLRHTSPISGIASYANQYIATAGYDNRVILWDIKDNLPIAVGNHEHLVNQCEFSSCGNYLVTSSSDHTARIWLIPQMKLIAVLSEHADDVECAIIHPNLPLVATASRDCKIRVFGFDSKLNKTLTGHTADVISIQWLENSSIVSSSDDGTIRVWDAESGAQVDQLNDSGVQTDALAISNAGTIYAGDDHGLIHLMSKDLKDKIVAHQAGIKKLVLDKKNKMLISIAYDRKACLWNVLGSGALQLHMEFSLPNLVWARSCAFHGDDKIIFATFGDSYAVYDYKTKQWQVDHIGQTEGINAILCSESNVWTIGDAGKLKLNNKSMQQLPSLCNFLVQCENILLTGGQTGEVFDALSGSIIYHHRSPLNCATDFIFKNNFFIIIGTYTGECLIFKKNNKGMQFDRAITLHDNAIKSIAVSGNRIFSVCATGAAAWHSLENDEPVKTIHNAHSKIANGCVALENEKFASISRDLFLRIWNGEHFSQEDKIVTPHTHSIKCISTDNTHRYLATGSYNGLVAIFDRDKKSWKTKRVSNAGISSIAFDKQSNAFIAASYDGQTHKLNRPAL